MASDNNDDILLDLFHPSLRLIQTSKVVAEASEDHQTAVQEVQADCGHAIVFRCEYEVSPYSGRSGSPLLQCAHCLIEESEWGDVLALGRPYYMDGKRKYLTISRKALYSRRLRGG